MSTSQKKRPAATTKILLALVLTALLSATMCHAASLDTAADRVLGQGSFITNNTNAGETPNASTLYQPSASAIDLRNGRLYVADRLNHRVLSWPSAAGFTNKQAADKVFGQADFTSTLANRGGTPTASTLDTPTGLAVDSNGNLYVADSNNHRVLAYDDPAVNDTVADRVLGQPDLTSNTINNILAGSLRLNQPGGLSVGPDDNVWIADTGNSRVFRRSSPYIAGSSTTTVIGQPDFSSTTPNTGGLSAKSLSGPSGVALNSRGDLIVADTNNNRVLVFTALKVFPITASSVLGQANFTSNLPNRGGTVAKNTLDSPSGVSVDSFDRLFVADSNNNRVLFYGNSFFEPQTVFGQPNFTSNAAMPVNQSSLSVPTVVAFDGDGNVYIADRFNQRVLAYDQPFAFQTPQASSLFPKMTPAGSADFALFVNGSGFVNSSVVLWNGQPRLTKLVLQTRLAATLSAADVAAAGDASVQVSNPGVGPSGIVSFRVFTPVPLDTNADNVLGQPDFNSTPTPMPVISAFNLGQPRGLAVDRNTGRLWVCDGSNSRVLSWPNAAAFTLGQPADFVLGRPDFFSGGGDFSPPNNTNFSTLGGIAVDANGNVYVADSNNHRVLEFDSPLATDKVADRVFGQPDFISRIANNGGISASSLAGPNGLAFDSAGSLYVADAGNHRVLVYVSPLSDVVADRVIGQPGFASNTPNNGGVSAVSLNAPNGITLDSQDNLYVADTGNNRVLLFLAPLNNGAAASLVFGQGNDFTTGTLNKGGLGAASLAGPTAVAVDRAGNLYVSDTDNNRVLEFDQPRTSDTTADRVFGQGNLFTVRNPNSGGLSERSLNVPQGLALAGPNLLVSDSFAARVLSFLKPVNNPPVITAGPLADPAQPGIGQNVLFSATASDPDDDALSYAWDFGDGGLGSGINPSHAYAQAGTYTVTVTVSDDSGGTASATQPLIVSPITFLSPPSASPAEPAVGETVTFSVSVQAPGGAALSFTWDFGDGATSSSANPTHVYSAPGVFRVILTVQDTVGNSATSGLSLNVTSQPVTPLTITKHSIKLNFAKAGSDSISVQGTVPVAEGFTAAGQTVVVNVGGATQPFTLNAKGSSKAGKDSLKLSVKAKKGVVAAQNAKFSLSLKGSFAAALAPLGLTDATQKKTAVTVPVSMVLSGTTFRASSALSYSATAGKSGSANLTKAGQPK